LDRRNHRGGSGENQKTTSTKKRDSSPFCWAEPKYVACLCSRRGEKGWEERNKKKKKVAKEGVGKTLEGKSFFEKGPLERWFDARRLRGREKGKISEKK